MFLSNWLVLQIVAAGVTGAVEYPSAADFFMNFDSNNRLYFSGGSKDYVSNLILYKGETEYPVYNGSVSNIYISDPASYVSYIQLCNETYVTNTVDVQTIVNPEGVFPDTETTSITGFATATVHGPSQGGFGGYIGFSGDGTRMVLGASVDFSSAQGRAYVYHLENGSWVQKVDIPSPNTSYQRFGDSVLINEDGTRIAVNHYSYSRIHIYEYTNGAWPTSPTTSITTSTNSGKGDMDWNTDGTVIVTGDGNEGGAGKTYVYRLSGGTWTETNIGNAGHGVSINGAGTRILAGVRRASGSYPNYTGKMYESNYDSGTSTWSSLTEVASVYPTTGWPTKIRMDNNGTTAIILTAGGDNSGIYERQSGSSWTESSSVEGYVSFYGMGTGSISYDGTMVLTGYYTYTGSVSGQGRAYLYEYTNGSWSLTKTFENPKTTPVAGDYWGYGTAITKLKDRIAIGMTGDDTAGTNYGSLYVYDLEYSYPTLTQDEYNKLTINSLNNIQSSRLTLNSNTYTANGPVSNFYVSEPGTYEVSASGSNAYAIVKKTVAAPVEREVFSLIPETLAFHHGNFDDVYGDGDVATAATNGHVYADTPLGSYSWGTLSANTTTSTETTYTWTPPEDGLFADVLVVAGGGGGGYAHGGGGGGAGGFREFFNQYIDASSSTIVVGSGGVVPTSRTTKGGNGNDTTFLSYTSTGGGGGGSYGNYPFDETLNLTVIGNPGGSGGGGSGGPDFDGPGGSGNTPSVTPSQGNNGGTTSNTANEGGAGGGGAGGAGSGTTGGAGANGGDGYTSQINGITYAGGGGGGAGDRSVGTGGTGGTGGGGTGDGSGGAATAGTPHTGGGGGGGGYLAGSGDTAGAAGGSGIVLLSYVSFSSPKLTYDTYNKLTLNNVLTSYSSTLRYESNTYDIGTASTIIIQDPGRYEIATTDNENFLSLNSNVTGQTVTQVGVYDYTQVDTTEQKITASDAATNDNFGVSVAIDGDYAIVGSTYGDAVVTTQTGTAHIFVRNTSTGTWFEQHELLTTDYAASDQFGFSVGISGDYAIIGARGNDDPGDSGSAYIFKRNATSGIWSELQKLVATDREASDQFGTSVSISGDYAIVGAYGEDTGGSGAGAAYIYKRDASTGVWGSEQKIQASDKEQGDEFGYSVSISGDYAIVGAWLDNVGSVDTNEGAAYIYSKLNAITSYTVRITSTQLGTSSTGTGNFDITPSDGAVTLRNWGDSPSSDDLGAPLWDNASGTSLQVYADGTIILAGETLTTYIVGGSPATWYECGSELGGTLYHVAITIVSRTTSDSEFVWGSEQKLQASDASSGDRFGSSVSISGDYAIVGAVYEDVGVSNTDEGAAYVFKRDGVTGTWSEQQKLTASVRTAGDRFGYSVAIDGDHAIVGADINDGSGSAYLFKRSGTNWTQQVKLKASDPAASNQFGHSVAIDDNGHVIIGSLYGDGTITNSGAAYVYTAENLVSTLGYDGLNTLVLSNVSTGSYNTLLEGSNVLACGTDLTTYPVPKSGITGTFTYSARTKSDSVYAFTNDVSITDYYKLYQYPPIDGTASGITTSTVADTFNIWTISGAANGNGTYKAKWSVATVDGTPYNTFINNVGSANQVQTAQNPTYPIDITLELPSAKTIRKYRMFPLDHVNPNGTGTDATSGTSVDPTLPGNGGNDATKRPKSWILYGYDDNPENPGWVSLDTVTDKPISIYGDIYSIDTPGSYQQYKLSVTANNGGDKLLFGDIQLWGDA